MDKDLKGMLAGNGNSIETKFLGGRPVTGFFSKEGVLMTEIKTAAGMYYKTEKTAGSRKRTGVFSTLGVEDDVLDTIEPGAFTKTLKDNTERFRFLWQHSFDIPPIAKVISVEEVGAKDLPEEIRSRAPEAKGGAVVTREYLNSDLAQWVLESLDAEAINEMSFAFDAIKWENVENEDNPWWPKRFIKELRLWEMSDVLWGANPVTMGDIQKALDGKKPNEIEDGATLVRLSGGLKLLSLVGLTPKSLPVDNTGGFEIVENFFKTLKEPSGIPEMPDTLKELLKEFQIDFPRKEAADDAAGKSTGATALTEEEISTKMVELATLASEFTEFPVRK